MRRKFTKAITLILVAAMLLPTLAGCHFHAYEDATCTAPALCECGESKGDALGHDYADATCTDSQVCSRCGKSTGVPLGHDYVGALSCTEPQTCSRCGKKGGTILGHDYSSATCNLPQVCDRCGESTGTALGHSYYQATCSTPQICRRCEETKGSPLGHNFSEATCVLPEICKRCGNTKGNPLGHKYSSNKCIRCGQIDPDSLPVGLDKLYVIDKDSNYTYSSGVFTDVFGDSYNGVHRYKHYKAYSIHNLRKEYTTFSGSFVAGSDMDGSTEVTIEIYVDDVLVYSIKDYMRETGKIDFSISVKNASKLKIKFTYQYNSWIDIGLVNAELKK